LSGAARRGGWVVEQRVGTAGALHRAWPSVEADPTSRRVAVCRPTGPALVLGSTQPESLVDRAAAARRGLEVVRRRSGGGAVLVLPGDPLWIDVWLPADDPLFEDDVGRAFWWIGDAWAAGLRRVGLDGARAVRRPAVRRGGDGEVACFGRASSGKVVAADGRKVVGLAQRRVRAGALFHGACLLTWDPALLVDLLDVGPDPSPRLVESLRVAAVGLCELLPGGADRLLAAGEAAFLDSLP